MSLTPRASLKDGLLDIIIVPKISRLKILFFGFCMLIKKIDLMNEVSYYQTDQLTLLRRKGAFFEYQIDGELSRIDDSLISISIKKQSLRVLI